MIDGDRARLRTRPQDAIERRGDGASRHRGGHPPPVAQT
jgi:hypothetical protein